MKKYIFAVLALSTIASVSAQTSHNLVVEDINGNKKAFPTEDVKTILFKDMPQYIETNTLLAAVYSTRNSMGIYDIQFGTETPDEDGNPGVIGGIQIALSLNGPTSENASRAAIPTGVYSLGTAGQPFTIDVSSSGCWVRVGEGMDGVVAAPIMSGTADVRLDGTTYDIRMEIVTLMGDEINLSYKGEIAFRVGSSEYTPFTEAVNVDFEGFQGRFYGNWFYPFSDDMSMQGYAGTFDANNTLTEGYWLNLELFMPKAADPMQTPVQLVDGVYTIDKRDAILNSTYLPLTFSAGGTVEIFEQLYNTGSYITYKAADGSGKIGYLDGGTITISNGGKKIVLDCVAENGTPISGTFTGSPYLENKCDNANSEPERPWGTIGSDITLDFTGANMGAFFYKDYDIVEGKNTYVMQIQDFSDIPRGDYIMLTFLSEQPALADGTYTISTDMSDKSVFPGWLTYTQDMIHSWYGDLDSADSEGYSTIYAPLASGTITVTTLDASRGEYKMVFDMTDDNGHKITGEYNGFVIDYDALPNNAPRKKSLRAKN